MGRSVETVRDSEKIYFDISDFDEDGMCWEDLCINVQYELEAKYKSLRESKNWMEYPFRETKVLLENEHIYITVSGYISVGVFCIFINPKSEFPELAEHWLNQNCDNIKKILKDYVLPLNRVGTFSNGVGVYEKEE